MSRMQITHDVIEGRIISSMNTGELLKYDNTVFILTNSGPSAHGDMCVCSLESGNIRWLDKDVVVIPIKATLNIYEQGPMA